MFAGKMSGSIARLTPGKYFEKFAFLDRSWKRRGGWKIPAPPG
jgi:hypothetical protein